MRNLELINRRSKKMTCPMKKYNGLKSTKPTRFVKIMIITTDIISVTPAHAGSPKPLPEKS